MSARWALAWWLVVGVAACTPAPPAQPALGSDATTRQVRMLTGAKNPDGSAQTEPIIIDVTVTIQSISGDAITIERSTSSSQPGGAFLVSIDQVVSFSPAAVTLSKGGLAAPTDLTFACQGQASCMTVHTLQFRSATGVAPPPSTSTEASQEIEADQAFQDKVLTAVCPLTTCKS